ncbi:MAG: DUF4252 domain-containing protein [Candidatus Saccharimonadaceae bacterium]
MKISIVIISVILSTTSILAGDFVTRFMEIYSQDNIFAINNVNIGNSMLEKMATNTADLDLKKTFQNLNSIRIITSENKKDSKDFYKKAQTLVSEEFSDFKEMVSVNENKTKMNVLFKKTDEKNQELILIGLDADNKLTIICITGKIDFNSISKLSETFTKENYTNEEDSISKQSLQKNN